jgi:hypothetical protein
MREVLALFQGKASFGTPQEAGDEGAAPRRAGIGYVRVAGAGTDTSTDTTVPVVAPEQNTLGVIPPNDPSCR